MQIRIANRNSLQRLMLAGCAIAVASSTGCKTGSPLPGASLFGWNKTPSAEMLAGQGPSTTYPAPPSSQLNPTAIASTAAGTGAPAGGTGTFGDVEAYAGTTVPNSAATANGFAMGNSTPATPAGFAGTANSSTATNAVPSYGNTMPSYGNTPASYGNMPPSYANAAPSYANAAPSYGNTPPSYGNTPPSYGYTPPTSAAPKSGYSGGPQYAGVAATNSPAANSPTAAPNYGYTPAAGGPSGYRTADASAAPGYSAPNMATGGATSSSPTTSSPPPSNYAIPDYGTISTATDNPYAMPSTPSTTDSQASSPAAQMAGGANATESNSSSVTPTSGYRPGSTSGATSYPSTPYTTPSGSMFR
ncbi:hypothetical protein SH139x_000590 [Planctomycetaceae bacterium SH139]